MSKNKNCKKELMKPFWKVLNQVRLLFQMALNTARMVCSQLSYASNWPMLPIDLHMQKKLAGKGGFLIPFLCKKKGENFLSEVRLEHLIPDNASLSNITKIRIARNFSLVHISPIWLYLFYIFVDKTLITAITKF